VQDLSDGHRILLTLDPVLQDSALQIFRNREVPYAAAVMLDLRDNAVLVFAGHSSMDPEVDPLEVLTTAWAPAASTFKLVTASALIDKGAATRATRVCFSGGLHGITDDALRDVPSRDKQCASLGAAIAHSYNLVLGKLALKHLGEDELRRMAQTLLFEQDIEFEFPIERSPAHIPSAPIERAKVATGFWNVDMSPVHGVLLASVFARGGMYQPPHIIARVMGPDGTDVTPPTAKGSRVLGKTVANTVASMMLATTTEGTARASFCDGHGNDYVPGVKVAGKTGSLTGKRPPALNYNWFVGFSPADAPEIAVAVLLANAPKWRIKAHYAGRRLIQVYQRRRQDIARQRDVRLTAEGLILPQRDPSGALVARVKRDRKKGAKRGGAGKKDPETKAAGSANAAEPGTEPGKQPAETQAPLPPVPGPVPPTSPSGS
jgi:cell division protein FtsI/penicillin-binding protein 2